MTTPDALALAKQWLDAYPVSSTPARIVVSELADEIERLRHAAADHAMSENYTLEGQAILVADRRELEAARATLAENGRTMRAQQAGSVKQCEEIRRLRVALEDWKVSCRHAADERDLARAALAPFAKAASMSYPIYAVTNDDFRQAALVLAGDVGT
jgi:hypothetical protein